MAEVTSGTPTNPLTVIVLDAAEARALTYLLTSHQRTGTPWQRFGVVAGLVEALTMGDGLCDECGHERDDWAGLDPVGRDGIECYCACHR